MDSGIWKKVADSVFEDKEGRHYSKVKISEDGIGSFELVFLRLALLSGVWMNLFREIDYSGYSFDDIKMGWLSGSIAVGLITFGISRYNYGASASFVSMLLVFLSYGVWCGFWILYNRFRIQKLENSPVKNR
jgi:hypothetical protein